MLRFILLVTVCAVLQVAVYADALMVTIDGHTMVKLRTFSHQFGAVTDYDAATNTYSVSRNGRTVYLIPYSSTAWIDDLQVELKFPPIIIDNALYVPLRFMCHAFDLDCTWGPAFLQVVIIDGITHQQVIWARDDGWAARPHTWQHSVTYRIPQQPQSPPRQSFRGRPSTVPPTIPGRHKSMPVVHGPPPAVRPPSVVHGLPPVVHGLPPTTHKPTSGAEQKPSHSRTAGSTSNNPAKAKAPAGKSPRGNTSKTKNDNKGQTQ